MQCCYLTLLTDLGRWQTLFLYQYPYVKDLISREQIWHFPICRLFTSHIFSYNRYVAFKNVDYFLSNMQISCFPKYGLQHVQISYFSMLGWLIFPNLNILFAMCGKLTLKNADTLSCLYLEALFFLYKDFYQIFLPICGCFIKPYVYSELSRT